MKGLLFFFILTSLNLKAQIIQVLDNNYNPIPYVYVISSSGKKLSDEKGIVQIQNNQQQLITCPGYDTVMLKTFNTDTTEVILKPNFNVLQEVVVKPKEVFSADYGKRKKKHFPYFPILNQSEFITELRWDNTKSENKVVLYSIQLINILNKKLHFRETRPVSILVRLNIYNANNRLIFASDSKTINIAKITELSFDLSNSHIDTNLDTIRFGLEVLRIDQKSKVGIVLTAEKTKEVTKESILKVFSNGNTLEYPINSILNKSSSDLGYKTVDRNFNTKIEFYKY